MTKRKNTKKKNTKRKHSKQQVNYRILNTLLIIIIALILVIGFIIYNADAKSLEEVNKKSKQRINKVETSVKKEISKVEEKAKEELNKYFDEIEIKKDKFEEYTKHLYEEYIDKEIEDYRQENKIKEKHEKIIKVEEKVKPILSKKPKLAIIVDDVTTQHQLNKIKDIGYTITASLLPPTKWHPNSAIIAKDLPFYMIHFPMQASTFKGEETHTLHIGDSYEKIEKRVAQIRNWYPNAKYTNNHTGSKFTSNEESMDRFFKALIKYDFIFMDSRTTAKSVAKDMARKYKMPYIVRNVFLDNEQDFTYIQTQLKKAIKIAKKNGYAIAICHPHAITLKTLKESKHLLDGLEMVYLNQLPFLN